MQLIIVMDIIVIDRNRGIKELIIVNQSYPSANNRISNLFTTKIFTILKDIVVSINKISIELTDELNLKLFFSFNIFQNYCLSSC